MSRLTLGIAAVVLLIIGGIVAFQQPEGGAAFAGACIRVGMVLGALWLALPQISYVWNKTPRWLLVVAAVALVFCVINPWYFVAAVPVLAGLWFLGPKVATIWKAKSPNTTAAKPQATSESQEPRPKRTRRRSNAR